MVKKMLMKFHFHAASGLLMWRVNLKYTNKHSRLVQSGYDWSNLVRTLTESESSSESFGSKNKIEQR